MHEWNSPKENKCREGGKGGRRKEIEAKLARP